MQTMAIAQAKNNFSAMLHVVEAGEEVVLTRHGRAVARIVPEVVELAKTSQAIDGLRQDAMSLLNELRCKVAPGPSLDWKELRDAGRRY